MADELTPAQKNAELSRAKGWHRQRIVQTPEEFEARVRQFYELCTNEGRVMTVAALCIFMGFKTKQSLYDYEKTHPEFADSIAFARLMIEDIHEQRLSGPNAVGSIFWLKNHAGYKDRHEVTGADGAPLETSTDELRNRLETRLAALATRIAPHAPNGNGQHLN